ncbi:MAG: hypothetical protein DRJ05_06055 [Bacteroidetes bacterium]|nr:MAG: hypothetical protein DRJ05_06055 [Bacteroidota bacterium]
MWKIVFLFVLIYAGTQAQVSDDFSDGDFTNDPEWFGDISHFEISNSSAIPPEMKPALKLNNSGSDTSVLYLPNTLMQNTEWGFWVKLSFNTTDNNNARVYLMSDQQNLEGSLNGYYVQVGGANDSIALFKQTGIVSEKIISGTNGYTGNSTNVLRIKVTRDNDGVWELFSDVEGGGNFQFDGSVTDNSFISTAYFGIFCKYTSSNSTKFYFDDFSVNEIIIDITPPEIQSLQVVSQNQLDIYFNEPITTESAENVLNYDVNGIGNPSTAQRDLANFSLVHLGFSQNFSPGLNYTLSVSGISDIAGNILESGSADFAYFETQGIAAYDIVINEIMADVNPIPINLPEADYVELYNTTGSPIDLLDCTIKPKGSSDPIAFPSVTMEPDSFLIIVSTSDVEEFEQYGQVVGLPGFSLNNEGTVTLRNADGSFIHLISYTEDWYKDEEKEDGGWSIEQIDPGNPCTGQENWAASVDGSGGTPGKRNSIDNIIYSSPKINSVIAVDDHNLRLVFSHFMDSISVVSTMAYFVDNSIGNPVSAIVEPGSFNSVTLGFSLGFQQDMVYELTITDTIFNCASDYIELNSTYNFVLPVKPLAFDVVFNEIMADPTPPRGLPEYEFLELYNATEKNITLQNCTLFIGTTEKPMPDVLIEPYGYLILTKDDAVSLFSYFGTTVGFSSFSLPNGEQVLTLIDEDGDLISEVTYSDEWYRDSEKADGGWTLEQIDPYNPCLSGENWIASDEDAGGTPGSINSVDADNPSVPGILKILSINNNSLKVFFNEIMDGEMILNPDAYYVSPYIGNPSEVEINPDEENSVILGFSDPFQTRTLYMLSVTDTINNCIGNFIPFNIEYPFGISEIAEKGDVVINEVLFNPADNGVDFVEIVNISEKIINPGELKLGNIDEMQFEPNDTLYKEIPTDWGLMLPRDYILLSKDPDKVKSQYFTENPDGFIRMSSFPSYSNDEGSVVLANKNDNLIDAFDYNEDMQFPLLNSVEGVTLERISLERPTYDETNWHSASEAVGFGTPAFQNSQYSETGETEDPVSVEPEVFSPDNDGYNDVLNILYKFNTAGNTANITIYDSQGRLTRILVQNTLLGAEGVFSWDGLTDDNQKAAIGIYIVFFEAFDLDGNVNKYKMTAVLGAKF